MERMGTTPSIRAAAKLLLLTMVRKSELTNATWSEISSTCCRRGDLIRDSLDRYIYANLRTSCEATRPANLLDAIRERAIPGTGSAEDVASAIEALSQGRCVKFIKPEDR